MTLLTEEKRKLLALRLQKRGIDAAHLSAERSIPRRDPSRPARLSFSQRRLWVLDRLEPGNPFYNIAGATELHGPLRPVVLARAFAEIARRHEALRTVFGESDGVPFQVVNPHPPTPSPTRTTPSRERGRHHPKNTTGEQEEISPSPGWGECVWERGPGGEGPGGAGFSADIPWPLPLLDLAGLPEDAARREAERLALAESRTPMDLALGPLVRTTLIRLGPRTHLLLVTLHHIVSDGWSNGLFLGEMVALYEAFAAGLPSPLPELPIQYADFAEWQLEQLQGERLAQEIAWWRERLAGAPAALELPVDRPRPAVQTFHGARFPLWIPPQRTEALRGLAHREGATLFMALLAAFDVLLRSWTGQEDVPVGSPVANRRRPEIEGLIGFFTNTLVLRADLSGDPSFRELLGRLREVAHGAFAHQDLPFEKLVEELQPERDLSRTPLFQVLVVLQNAPPVRAVLADLEMRSPDFDPGVSKFDLMLDLTELEGGLRGALEYNTDLFDRATIERLAGRFDRVLDEVTADPGRRLSGLALLPDPERRLLAEWSAGPEAPEFVSVVDLIEAQVRRTPEAPAVVGLDGAVLSYRELDERANRLAGDLLARGLGRGARVAFSLDRSPELVITILGILKAGAAYVPIDPAYPEERRAFMLEDSRAAPHPRPLSHTHNPRPGEGSPLPPITADDLAYILYTSGSTGRPKGVAMRHGALAALIRWQIAINTPGNRSGSGRTLQATSPSFDVSFQEIVSTWAAGGCLVLISEEDRRDPAALLARLRAERIERLFLPFVGLQQLAEAARGTALPTLPDSLREVVTAGEQLRITPAVAELFARLPGARLHNHYGPSETHVVTSFTLEGDPASWPALPPIGRPIAGARAHVVDLDGRPAAVGAPGELLLGGALLARGYLDRPELTAERFVPDPFAAEPHKESGARLYRTGDLARWRPDGELEFLGRIDAQVKIRGHRVEPGEIEAVLEAHPAVAVAAVVVREERSGDLSGQKRLVAWVVPVDGEEIDPRELRRHLAERLPDPMVPAAIVAAPSLPLTPSGKVDRRALARQAPAAPGTEEGFIPPRTSTEEILASIWAEVLGVERVGAESNFFELGGHSLLATQVVSRVRDACGAELPLRVVFEAPTLAGFTERIEQELGRGADAAPLSAAVISIEGRDRVAPLSFGQHRLWFLERLVPGSPVFNLPLALRLAGRLHLIPLSGAFAAIVRRHEALRTVFAEEAGQPVQIVLDPPPTPWFPLPLVDLTALPRERARAEADRRGREEGRRAFDLSRGPLLRALLLRLGPEEHVAVVTLHHIASDAWSLGVLVREIGGFYTALAAGRPSALPALPVQYPDYAVWQRGAAHGERMEAQLGWWKQALAGAPQILEIPADRPRPPVQSRDGAQRAIVLPPDLAGGVRLLGRREGTTLFMTLLATFVGLLSRLTGAEDLLVGSPVAGRTRPELEPLIGFFVNDLVLRGDLGGDPLFRHLLSRVRTTALGALAHQEVPFERLVEEIVEERSLSRHPLVQVAFSFQNTPSGPLVLPGLSLTPWDLDSGTAKLDLLLSLSEERGKARIDGVWEYSTELFDLTTIDRMSGHFLTLLAGAVEEPGRRVSELPLLTTAERTELATWNGIGTTPEEPRETLLHDLFLAWAERAPDAPAVIQDDRVLSYGELRAAAERLARRLRALGVGPEVRVAVCLDETIERVAAILGVLQAGGAWVPVDPSYPPERVARMLEDSAASVLLTREALLPLLAALPPTAATALCVDGEGLDVDADLPARPADPDNLAFVMYTSGSTGQPNGVMIRHRSVVRFVEHAVRSFPLGPGKRSLQMVSFSFDPSILEIWTALASGAALCVARREARFSGEVLAEELRRYGAAYATIVPSLLAQLPVRSEELTALRTVSIGGEGCPAEVADRWAERLRLVNCYGPTEATVHVAEAVCVGRQHREPPIGRPVAGARLWVLDRNLQPLPVGVPGALWIAGPGLARGYLNRPDLTAERFLPDPLGGEPGARLYNSGDIARLLPDGNLELLGRVDHQVKVRGLRIELGEIEAVLRTHPELIECAVVGEGVAAERRLVAFAVPRPGTDPERLPDPAALRAFLRERLPESMIPSAFLFLEALPRSPVGKTDRGALGRLAAGAVVARETGRTPPDTPTERALAEIWAEVLGLESAAPIGLRDGFFELGGHSLVVTRVISRIRERWGIDLSLLALFEAPALEEMARRIDEAVQEALDAPRDRSPHAGAALTSLPSLQSLPSPPPIPPLLPVHLITGPGSARPGELRRAPLSFAQRRLWFLHQLHPGSAAYNLPLAVRLTGALDVAALAGSLDAIVRRHETLRTTFETVQGEPWQVISGEGGVTLPLIDLSALPAGRGESAAAWVIRSESLGAFDLERGPLFRAGLLRLGADEHVLVAVMHHIIGDGWSLGVLIQELGELYPALRSRKPPALPPLPVQYADFAVWQNGWLRGETLESLLAWWRRELEGAPQVLDLPTDRPRPPVHTFRGAEEPFALSAGLADAVRDLARREGMTPFMVFLAGLEVLLGRWSGQNDLLIGSPVANRTRLEVEPLIGFFVNTLVHRGRLEGAPSFRGLLGRVRAAALEAFAHQDLPFELLVDELGVERTRRRTPLYQVLFVLQNAPAGPLRLPDLVLDEVPLAAGTAKTDLLLALADSPEGAELRGTWEYATDLFDAATAGRLARGFATLLAGAVADPEARLGDLPLLPPAERLEVLTGRNRTTTSYPRGSSLGALFNEVAARTPEAVAVAGETSLTYAELERLSARVARRLRARGARLEERIALAADRSPGLIAALLGIVRAGGAYLPLDPTSPPGRLAWMLQDAGARLLIADRRMLDLLPPSILPPGMETVALDELLAESGEKKALPALPNVPAEALAYVMYTSGSTGTPKGVAVTHRNVVRLVRGTESLGIGAEMGADQVWLQMAPVSFDAATLEIWAPLLNGGRLALLPPGRAGLDDIADALARHAVTSLWLTAGLFHQMVDHRIEALCPLRQLLAGGDVVSAAHARRVLEAVPGLTLIDGYGPTEGTTFTCCHRIRTASEVGAAVPIGRPIANARVYVLDVLSVLDGDLRPVPPGVAGELLAGGDGLARGYLGRPELTAERFVPDPFSGLPGERLYRTGDRVRWRNDATLEFLGRLDQQVKIRGFRVEPEEVEAVLVQHPAVRQAVVLAREGKGGAADRTLAAWVVPAEPSAEQRPRSGELQSFLRERLPEPMIPTAWAFLEALPLTANGKVDRRALPDPESVRSEDGSSGEPRTPLERDLVELAAAVLDVEKVGIHDNFFDLGGHSLLATQLVARLNDQLGCEVSLHLLFDATDFADLAEKITEQELEQVDEEDLASLLEEIDGLSPEEMRELLAPGARDHAERDPTGRDHE